MVMAASGANSQLLVASFAHQCATSRKLKLFEEEDRQPTTSEDQQTSGGSAAEAADDLTNQLADLRAFGASLLSETPATATVGSGSK